jgi:hypothetical protein
MNNWGERRLGPLRANLKKSRADRHAELKGLLRLPGGKVVIEYYFLKYTGGLQGAKAPLGDTIIQTILDHEYPTGRPHQRDG